MHSSTPQQKIRSSWSPPTQPSHHQHHAKAAATVLVMEGIVFGHGAVPRGLQLAVQHLELR